MYQNPAIRQAAMQMMQDPEIMQAMFRSFSGAGAGAEAGAGAGAGAAEAGVGLGAGAAGSAPLFNPFAFPFFMPPQQPLQPQQLAPSTGAAPTNATTTSRDSPAAVPPAPNTTGAAPAAAATGTAAPAAAAPGTVPPAAGAAPAPAMNPFMMNPFLMNLMQPGMVQTPQQRWASELQQLRDMGFENEQECLQALQATGGNVSLALERLLGTQL